MRNILYLLQVESSLFKHRLHFIYACIEKLYNYIGIYWNQFENLILKYYFILKQQEA